MCFCYESESRGLATYGVFILFCFSGLVLYGALGAVTYRNLVVCALHLAGSMLALAGLFFIMGAHFFSGCTSDNICRCSYGFVCYGCDAFRFQKNG